MPAAIHPKGRPAQDPVKLDRELERELVAWTKEQFEPLVEADKMAAAALRMALGLPKRTPLPRTLF